MSKYDVIAFDLDGTLTDPKEGLCSGFEYCFKKLSLPYASRESLSKYIGPSLFELWQEDFGLTPDESNNAIMVFREYYNIYGWWDNEVYDGIEELLTTLKSQGKKLVVATSKPEVTAKKVLRHFGLDKYFDYIAGASMNGSEDLKWQILDRALSAVGAEKSESILVGDRKYDAEGAEICGIDSLGVLWGHGSREELENAGFTYIAPTPDEVTGLI